VSERPAAPAVGLCADCRHARVVETARGSRFWRCARADEDPRYARYPPLPVRACPGHETGGTPRAPG
jgi:hypothetical protein